MATRTMHQLQDFQTWESMSSQILELCTAEQKPAVVLVSAQWCGPCKTLKSNILLPSKLEDAYYDRVLWFVMDIDLNSKELQDELNIRSVPRVMYMAVDGNVEVLGANPVAQIKKKLDQSQ